MTVLSRGARNRRGRRPGWLLLTTLLVLAIVASSALVFTNEVELLKLAVILSLWAAVIAAFVSVIYRRQSDVDAARARDLKLVYDLQLDREISARREYELSVETHLRRELASELRAQAADEVAALRAELAALRANLEILFDADLGDRPALEGDRVAAGYGDWTRDTATMPPTPGRVESSRITPVTEEDSTGGTAENPIIDVPEEPLAPPQPPQQRYGPPPPRRRHTEDQPYLETDYRGSHRRSLENPENGERLPAPEPPFAPPPPQRPEPQPVTVSAPEPEPEPEPAAPRPRHVVEAPGNGQSAPAMTSPPSPPPPAPRHRGAETATEPDEGSGGLHAGGQSVGDLLARLQANGTGGGGRRRRRED